MPTLGWERAYRSGDLVRYDGRGPGLRRAAPTTRSSSAGAASSSARSTAPCWACPGVSGAAAAVRTHRGGQQAAGRLRRRRRRASTPTAAVRAAARAPARRAGAAAGRGRRACRPAPRARSTATRCPGRCRDADAAAAEPHGLDGTGGWLAELWIDVLGADGHRPDDDFFDLGGGSLTAAQLVSPAARALPRGHRRRRLRAPRPRRRWPATLDEHGRRPTAETDRRVRPVPRRRPRSARSPSPSPLPHAHRAALADLARAPATIAGRASLGLDWLPDRRRGGWVVVGLAAAGHPARPDGCSAPPGARLLLRGVAPGDLPARRQGAPAAVARRAARRRAAAPPTSPARRWMPLLRAGARRQGRQRRRPALAPAGHRHAHARQRLLGRARGRPGRPLARRRRAARRRGRGRRRRPRRRPQHAAARAPSSAHGAEVAPGSAVFGAVPAGESWSGSPGRAASAPPAGPGRPSARRSSRALGGRRTPRSAVADLAAPARSPSLAGVRRARCPRSRRRRPSPDARCARACSGCRSATVVAVRRAGAADLAAGAAALARARARAPPGPQPACLAGVGDPAGARRGAHLAVPALLQPAHAGVAARCSGPRIGPDVEASTVLLIPHARRRSATAPSSPTTP